MSSVKLNEFIRLKKLMMLAANNPNDNEAIRAFRHATEIIRTHGYTWDQLLDRRVTVLSEVEMVEADIPSGRAEPEEIEERHFDLAISNAQGSFLNLLTSIHEQWEAGRNLSLRQREIVLNAASRAVTRR